MSQAFANNHRANHRRPGLKILLTNPPVQYLHTTTFLLPGIAPVGLLSLAGAVRAGNEVRVIDHARRPFSRGEALEEARRWRPDVVGVSVHFPPDALAAWELIAGFREAAPDSLITAGGPIPTYLPEPFLRAGADCVVLREGEVTFAEVVGAAAGGGRDLGKIAGLCVQDGGEVRETAPRPVIDDLDALPLLPFYLLPPYPAVSHRGRAASMETVRGCPFRCEYCSTPSFFPGVRYFSNDRIMSQLDAFRAAGMTEVFFVDDIFAVHPEKYLALLEEIVRRGHGMRFGTCVRADAIVRHPALPVLLGRAGFYAVNVGFEEYDDAALAALGKRSSAEVNLAAARALRDNDVAVIGSHIFGAPGASEAGLRDSVRTGIRNSDIFRLGVYTPHVGSPLYRRLRGAGIPFDRGLDRQSHRHYNLRDGRDPARMQREFFRAQLSWYLAPRTMAMALGLDGAVRGRLARRAYLSAAVFTAFGALRGAGIAVL